MSNASRLRRISQQLVWIAAVPITCLAVAPVFAQFELPQIDPFGGEEQEGSFDLKRLQRQGVAGLTEVLDEMLPDTAEPKKLGVPEATVHELVRQLGDDSYRVREAAMRKLSEIGDGARPILIKATKDANAEISWRATRVLRGWEGQKYAEKAHLMGSFARYCSALHDQARLDELARRTKLALDHGLWGESRGPVLQQCMMTLLRTERSDFVDLLKPYLKHQDLQIAMLVTEAAAQTAGGQGRSVSPLFLAALQSERDDVVAVAINYTMGGLAAGEKNKEVERALLAILGGKNENLKFQAAYPLWRQFKHAPAYDFILEQVTSGDMGRRYNALSWLQAEQHMQKTPEAKLVKAVAPLLRDNDQNTRMMAANTLATYKGEEVVRLLLPLLKTKKEEMHVGAQVASQLLQQPDKKMLRRVVNEELEKKPEKMEPKDLDALQKALKSFLKQIDQHEAELKTQQGQDPFGAPAVPAPQ